MEDWNGKERRKTIERDGVTKNGRRKEDEHCSQHDLLWKHHDEDAQIQRSMVCGKIKSVNDEVTDLRNDVKDLSKSTTPWKVFALSTVVLIGLVGWLAQKIDKGQDEIKASIVSVHQRITTNDKDIDSATKNLADSLKDLNGTILSIDNRLNKVEKHLEQRGIK